MSCDVYNVIDSGYSNIIMKIVEDCTVSYSIKSIQLLKLLKIEFLIAIQRRFLSEKGENVYLRDTNSINSIVKTSLRSLFLMLRLLVEK